MDIRKRNNIKKKKSTAEFVYLSIISHLFIFISFAKFVLSLFCHWFLNESSFTNLELHANGLLPNCGGEPHWDGWGSDCLVYPQIVMAGPIKGKGAWTTWDPLSPHYHPPLPPPPKKKLCGWGHWGWRALRNLEYSQIVLAGSREVDVAWTTWDTSKLFCRAPWVGRGRDYRKCRT